ncbi:hypothetical protein PVAP13_1KG154877 [Panicum virgatum]|uniref:F-box protein n=2 Tax=Panicum virgatum TaxID=38727 RepID=A0A8T0X7G1_PANVG|nr:hypothetical protein PVAP13_1KG154877 [Panicum virgatum]
MARSHLYSLSRNVCYLHPRYFSWKLPYWYLVGDSTAILEFDLDRQRLAVIDMPFKVSTDVWVIPADGGVLGFLYLSKYNVYLWKRETDGDGVAGWVLGKTIQLDNLLPLSSTEAWYPKISGFAEDDKVLLIGTDDRIFTIQLESMKFVQFKICFATLNFSIFHPFSSVYTAGMGLGDEHEGAELLFNA